MVTKDVLYIDMAELSSGSLGLIGGSVTGIERGRAKVTLSATFNTPRYGAYLKYDPSEVSAESSLIHNASLDFYINESSGAADSYARLLVYVGTTQLDAGEIDVSAFTLWARSAVVAYQEPNVTNGVKRLSLEPEMARLALINGALITLLQTNPSGGQISASTPTALNQSPSINVTYEDASTPSEVTILSPVGTTIDADSASVFQWAYSQPTGAPQSFIDIQYYANNQWVAIVEHEAWSEPQWMVPPGILIPGSTIWRMRAYHIAGTQEVASAWAQAGVVIRGRPSPPIITNITTTPRPLVEWTAPNQSGYQVMISIPAIGEIVHNSGAIFSAAREWKCPKYLTDGRYTVSVRVINSESVWSEWATQEVVIANQPGAPIGLTATATNNYGAGLAWATEGDYEGYFIYRNGEPIARTTGKTYTDYFSIGKTTYTVRGVTGDVYTDSNSDTLCLAVKGAVMSSINPVNWLCVGMRRGSRPTHDIDYTTGTQYVYYEGRALPQKVAGGQRGKTHTLSLTLRTEAEYLHLESLLDQTVIYKNRMGQRIIGNLDNISPTIERMYDVDISIVETDVQEVIADA